MAQDAAALADVSPSERRAGDHALRGLSPDRHPRSFLRPALGESVASTLHLRALSSGAWVAMARLVVCRQGPPAARGMTFL